MKSLIYFDKLTNSITDVVESQFCVEDKVKSIRSLVKATVQQESFVLDSIELLLNSLEKAGLSNWKNPAVYNHPNNLYSIRYILWPQYYCNNPHKHKTWSVTAVIENTIKVHTFVWKDNEENTVLLGDKELVASAKEVGFLLPECIHKLENPTPNLTLTMHIFNHFDTHTSGVDNAVWYPEPEKANIFENVSQNALYLFSNMLVKIKSERSRSLLFRTNKMNLKQEIA